MKQCPVCGASSFEDMMVCFGCMYRFDQGGAGHMGNASPVSVAGLIGNARPVAVAGHMGNASPVPVVGHSDVAGRMGVISAREVKHVEGQGCPDGERVPLEVLLEGVWDQEAASRSQSQPTLDGEECLVKVPRGCRIVLSIEEQEDAGWVRFA